jgi:DnaJ-class molecular chaperone
MKNDLDKASGMELPTDAGTSEHCARCNGTGLVCGHIPVIGPGSCCVDYANAVCPDCRGTGKRQPADS